MQYSTISLTERIHVFIYQYIVGNLSWHYIKYVYSTALT